MSADDDVDFPLGEVGENSLDILGGASAAQIVDSHREILKAVAESVVVLIGEHRGGHQHGSLLVVGSSLKGGTDSHLGFTEAHIAAN